MSSMDDNWGNMSNEDQKYLLPQINNLTLYREAIDSFKSGLENMQYLGEEVGNKSLQIQWEYMREKYKDSL